MEARDAALLARIRWLIGLRWLAAAGVVGLSAFSVHVLGLQVALAPLQLIGVVIAIYNVGCRAWLLQIRKSNAESPRAAINVCANAQISADLIALGLVVHYTGGIESPLAFFFLFHTIIGSMILSREAAYAQATLVVALYGAVVLLEANGLITHYHLGIGARPDMYRSPEAWPILAVTVATLYVAIYLASTIMSELHERDAELAALTRDLAEQARVCQSGYAELERTQRHQVEYMRRIAHELKSPLAAISMTLRAALDSFPEPIPDKQHEMILRAVARAKAATELTDDLLTLSQLKEAAAMEEPQEVSLSHLIENVTAEDELAAEEQHVTFAIDIEHGLHLVRGRRSELADLLRNLVSNAIKFTPAGGEVAVRAYSQADSVILEVQDQGIGIPEEELPHIFDEFYRAAAVRKARIAGTGLGLPIVKSIVELHDGEITVDSEVGEGTTFRVRLPAAPEGAPTDKA